MYYAIWGKTTNISTPVCNSKNMATVRTHEAMSKKFNLSKTDQEIIIHNNNNNC
jgi:hypothetical protein